MALLSHRVKGRGAHEIEVPVHNSVKGSIATRGETTQQVQGRGRLVVSLEQQEQEKSAVNKLHKMFISNREISDRHTTRDLGKRDLDYEEKSWASSEKNKGTDRLISRSFIVILISRVRAWRDNQAKPSRKTPWMPFSGHRASQGSAIGCLKQGRIT